MGSGTLPGAKSKTSLPAFEQLGMENDEVIIEITGGLQIDKRLDPPSQRLRKSMAVVKKSTDVKEHGWSPSWPLQSNPICQNVLHFTSWAYKLKNLSAKHP